MSVSRSLQFVTAAIAGFALLMCRAEAAPQARDTSSSGAASVRAAGTAVISGMVTTTDARPQPIRRAIVSLSGTISAQILTDDAGRFAFKSLPPGRYTLTAEKPAYLKVFHGSPRIGRGPGTPIAISDAQSVTGVSLRLARGAVVTGTVTDVAGQPLGNAQVTPRQVQMVEGQRKLVAPSGWSGDWATTDDRGIYRLFGLPPGTYVVGAVAASPQSFIALTTAEDVAAAAALVQRRAGVPGAQVTTPALPPARTIGWQYSYYPSVAEAAVAELITLSAGDERGGIDIRVPLVRTTRIEGTAVGPTGQPISNILVGLADLTKNSLWGSPGLIRPDATGHFRVPPLAPGRYLLFGVGAESGSDRDPHPLWTETEVLVQEQDLTDVTLRFLPGSTVTGRVAPRLGATAPDFSMARLSLTPLPTIPGATASRPTTSVAADGTFTFSGVAPGQYRLALFGVGTWALKSAVVQGHDTLDAPLDVVSGQNVSDLAAVITDQPSLISGTLFDSLGRPTPEFAVVVFAADRAYWTTAPRRMSGLVKLGTDGKFTVTGLPAGEYIVAAVTDLEPDQLSDPAVLEQLAAGGIRVTLADGERKVQDIRIR